MQRPETYDTVTPSLPLHPSHLPIPDSSAHVESFQARRGISLFFFCRLIEGEFFFSRVSVPKIGEG
jgi:hypothetical protein